MSKSGWLVKSSKRDFTRAELNMGIDFVPERYSWRATGGPDAATIIARGSEFDLWSLLNWIRRPIELWNPQGTRVWWGFVEEVGIRIGAIDLKLSIIPMYNSIAVAYNEIAPGDTGIGVRGTTAYALDAISSAEFGTKQTLISLADQDAASATNLRDRLIDDWSLPFWVPNPKRTRIGDHGYLKCAGLFDHFDWLFYNRQEGREAHENWDDSQAWGAITQDNRIKQTFKIPAGTSGWDAGTAAVRCSKEDLGLAELSDPTIEVWSDSGGNPSAQLATGTIDRTTIPDLPTYEWVTANWGTNPTLAADTLYHFILNAQGPYTNEEYAVQVDEQLGYPRGTFTMKNNGSWVSRSPDADLAFRISGVEETTVQMEAIYDEVNQFFTGFYLEVAAGGTPEASGIFTTQYRDGDNTGYDELIDLLAIGKSGGRRYVATVTPDRELRITIEPDPPTDGAKKYKWLRDGRVRKGAAIIPNSWCPTGFWLDVLDLVPASVRQDAFINPNPVFIERTEYNVAKDTLQFDPRDVPGPFEINELLARGR